MRVMQLGLLALTLVLGLSSCQQSPEELERAKQARAAQERGAANAKFAIDLTKAQKGDPDAQYNVALDYSEGKGTPKSDAEARAWMEKSARSGYVFAQHMLSIFYQDPQNPDWTRAAYWARQAAGQGDTGAMYDLAGFYRDGIGVPQDRPLAVRWLRVLAATDDGTGAGAPQAAAMSTLGSLTLSGEAGVARDPVAACTWYLLAAQYGDDEAIGALPAVRQALTGPEQLQAQQRADAFHFVPFTKAVVADLPPVALSLPAPADSGSVPLPGEGVGAMHGDERIQ